MCFMLAESHVPFLAPQDGLQLLGSAACYTHIHIQKGSVDLVSARMSPTDAGRPACHSWRDPSCGTLWAPKFKKRKLSAFPQSEVTAQPEGCDDFRLVCAPTPCTPPADIHHPGPLLLIAQGAMPDKGPCLFAFWGEVPCLCPLPSVSHAI